MTSGIRTEVQYPWHSPDGKIVIVRCGGVRNFKYTKGIRIEGVHQDVTHLIHYEKELDEKLARKTIRKMCLKYKVSYITTLAAALAAVRGIEATKDGNRGVGGDRKNLLKKEILFLSILILFIIFK